MVAQLSLPSRHHIVLVDDNALDLFINQKVVVTSRLAARVETLQGGLEAITYLEACRQSRDFPTLLLLDVNMPAMDGFEVLTLCQQQGYLSDSTRVVMLTSSAHPRDKQRAEELGALFMEKPLQMDKLLHCIGHTITPIPA